LQVAIKGYAYSVDREQSFRAIVNDYFIATSSGVDYFVTIVFIILVSPDRTIAAAPSSLSPSIPANHFLWELEGIISFLPENQCPSSKPSSSPNVIGLVILYLLSVIIQNPEFV
jgi:hypothetical protein